MNRTQVMALDLVLCRLDPKHPDFAGSEEVETGLSEDHLRRYLDTWVMPLVEAAARPETIDRHTRENIRRQWGERAQAAQARRRFNARKEQP